MFLLGVFFPSWRFFEERGLVPKLSYRVVGEGGAGSWKECIPAESRRVSALLFNPAGNLRMARNSLLERLVSDAGELGDGPEADAELERLVSYQLVVRLVRRQLAERARTPAEGRFQFRVIGAVPGSGEHQGEELLLSSEHEV